jgi:lipoteichoic acid synthase
MGRLYQLFGSRPFIFFSIIMILKSYLAWLVIFDDTPVWSPLVAEIPFIWIVFCMIEWFATKRKMLMYLIVNLLLTGIFFAVIMYYKYYGVIVTYKALEQVNQVTAVKNSVFSLIDPYFLFIFTDILIVAYLLFRYRKDWGSFTGRSKGEPRKITFWRSLNMKNERRGVMMTVFTISLVLCLLNILPNRASMNERVKAAEMGILNYEAYTILADNEVEPVDKAAITQAAIDELKGTESPFEARYAGTAKGKNLIVIQMESFQNFLIGLEIDGKEITPTINGLARNNFYFPNFYQQVGQGNTSDAEFVVNTSFYIPPDGAATMRYVDKVLPSLPRLAKENGYFAATFHTNVVEFWNRAELYSSLGWDRYYDDKFFGTEDSIFFGASDEVLYRKTAAELARLNEEQAPYYAQVISMTAHHPFTIPAEKDQMTLPERYQDTMVGDYIRSQNYADYALGQFIEQLKESGVWEDSLIVLYGDHLGLPIYSLDKNEQELMAEIYGREYGYTDMINVPLVIVSQTTYPATFDQIGGQVDILPTVANLMGMPLTNQIHYGQDLLNQEYNLLPQRYYLPSGSLVTGRSLFMPGEGYADGTLYPLSGDEGDTSTVSEDEYNRALQLLHWSDSYIKQLPDKAEGAVVEGAEPPVEESAEVSTEVETDVETDVETNVEDEADVEARVEDAAAIDATVETVETDPAAIVTEEAVTAADPQS